MPTTYRATFQPEAWVNDYAIPVDPEGPTSWDCSTFACEQQRYLNECERRRGESLDDGRGVLDNDDVFKEDPDAPDWVRTWRGPFTIHVRREYDSPNDQED